MTIQDVKQIKLADYLQSLGYTPVKQQGRNLWYKSPLREETDASFKVNTELEQMVRLRHRQRRKHPRIGSGTLPFGRCSLSAKTHRGADHTFALHRFLLADSIPTISLIRD